MQVLLVCLGTSGLFRLRKRKEEEVGNAQGGSPLAPSARPSGASWPRAPAAPSALGGQVVPSAEAAQRLRSKVPWTWTLSDPISALETYREQDVWNLVRKTHVEPTRLLAFTHLGKEELSRGYGLGGATVLKVSRMEGEEHVSPADVDHIADVVSRHFAAGLKRVAVLPGLETVVESTNVRNVRRMLDLIRDLAMESKGAFLYSLDPGSLAPTELALLERGSRLLHAQAPVPSTS